MLFYQSKMGNITLYFRSNIPQFKNFMTTFFLKLGNVKKNKLLNKNESNNYLDTIFPKIISELIMSYDYKFTGETLYILPETYWLSCVQELPNERISFGLDNGLIKIWNLKTQRCEQTLQGHTRPVIFIKILPDQRIVTYSDDKIIKIWDLKTGNCDLTLIDEEKTGFINDLVVLSDGRFFCSYRFRHSLDDYANGMQNKKIKIWDPSRNGKYDLINGGHDGNINCHQILDNGLIISGASSDTLKIWDPNGKIEPTTLTLTYNTHAFYVSSICVVNDIIVCIGAGGHCMIINIKNNKQIDTTSSQTENVNCICRLNDEHIISGSNIGMINIWNIQNGQCEMSLYGGNINSINGINVLPDGKIVSKTNSINNNIIDIWDPMNSSNGYVLLNIGEHTIHHKNYVLSNGRIIIQLDNMAVKIL